MSFESAQASATGGTSIGINGHDIHCKARYPQLTDVELCLWCSVIRVVRDEEQAYALSAYNTGYMDGYSDAEAHAMEWSLNEDNDLMSTNGDNDATNNS